MEGEDDELEDSDCIPRLLEDVQSVHVVSSYFAHANQPRRLFEGGVYFTQRLQFCGVYSRARLFEAGIYSRKYGSHDYVFTVLVSVFMKQQTKTLCSVTSVKRHYYNTSYSIS